MYTIKYPFGLCVSGSKQRLVQILTRSSVSSIAHNVKRSAGIALFIQSKPFILRLSQTYGVVLNLVKLVVLGHSFIIIIVKQKLHYNSKVLQRGKHSFMLHGSAARDSLLMQNTTF